MPFIQFQLRRGTDALWSSTNPVLAAGEMALETNTNRYKFGDGVLPWNSLPYGGTIQENSVFSSITVYQTTTTSNLAFSGKMKITQPLPESIAIGYDNGLNQAQQTIAIGAEAGKLGQEAYSIAIGTGAGYNLQKERAIAIGTNAGYSAQNPYSIAIGDGVSENVAQGACSIGIGRFAGYNSLQPSTIIINATGATLNSDKPRAFYVAPIATRSNIGTFYSTLYYDNATKEVFAGPSGGGSASINSNYSFSNLLISDTTSTFKLFADNISTGAFTTGGSITTSNIDATWGTVGVLTTGLLQTPVGSGLFIRKGAYQTPISIGYFGGGGGGGTSGSIAIGDNAGFSSQNNSIAIGLEAGYTQGPGCIALGYGAGSAQEAVSVAIGVGAGQSQSGNAIALGTSAGSTNQRGSAIAIGVFAGNNFQSTTAIAIGAYAGSNSQGISGVAIGTGAGSNSQGQGSIAIGQAAGLDSQHSSTIILNATMSTLNSDKQSAFYVAPVATRTNPGAFSTLYYDGSTKEVFAGPVPNGGGGFIGSNFGFSNVGVIDTISSSSTFTNYFSAAQAYVSSLVVGTAFVVGQNTLVVYGSTILAGPTISRGPVIVETSNAANTLVATLSGSSSSGSIQYSTDNGVSWNLAQKGGFTSSKNKPIGNNVAFGKDANNNPLFIAVGSSAFNPENSIQRSTDGKNWTPVTTGGLGTDAVSVAYNANTWVVGLSAFNVSADNFHSTLQVSKDGGLNFNAALTTEATQGTTFDVALKDASTFVAAGLYDNNSTILYTTNGGQNWLFGQSNTLLDARGVAYGNRVDGSDLWVAVGTPLIGIEDRTSTIQWSTDAINWQPAVSGGFGTSSGQLGKKVAYLSTATTRTWVAVGSYDYNYTIAPIQYSSDGSNWASASPASSWTTGNCDPVVINTITWTGSQWVALGSNVNFPQSYYTTDESGATGWTTFNPISSNILGSAAGIVNIFETASVGGNNPSYSNLSVANTATMNTANISTLTVSTIVCSASTIITGGVVVPQLSNALYPWPGEGSVLSFSNTQADSVVYNYYVNDVYVSQETFNSYAVKEFPVSKSSLVKFKFVNNNTSQAAFDGFSIANGAQIGYNTVDTDPYQQNLYFSVVYPPTLLTNQNIKTTSVNVVSSIVYNETINIGTRDYYPIHIGFNAGSGQNANVDIGGIAIGNNAATGYHEDTDGGNIAIGKDAGTIQLGQAIALGYLAGAEQQPGAIAIGVSAGPNQGRNAIALGSYATQSPQHSNTIVINASGDTGSITTDKYNAMYVAPIATRTTHSNFSTLYYDNSTKEVFAGPVAPVMKAGYASLDSGGNQLITFNKPFTTAITSVVATYSNQGSAVVASLRTQNWTTSNVSISGEPELNFGWVAMGY